MSHTLDHVPGRRLALRWLILSASAAIFPIALPQAFATEDKIAKRFKLLSENGNSGCSGKFLNSIASMKDDARLQGSCCGPMALHRYREQLEGLKAYSNIPIIPPDPYDVEVRLAKTLLSAYQLKLQPKDQIEYDTALKLSDEGGPCCCECWRWNVFGGLGKLLIAEHRFDGPRLAKVWNLSDGCGGDEHVH